jgi:hypothetical protein
LEQLLKLSEETLLDLKKQKLLEQLNLFESETKDEKPSSQTKLKENSELSDLVGNGLVHQSCCTSCCINFFKNLRFVRVMR